MAEPMVVPGRYQRQRATGRGWQLGLTVGLALLMAAGIVAATIWQQRQTRALLSPLTGEIKRLAQQGSAQSRELERVEHEVVGARARVEALVRDQTQAARARAGVRAELSRLRAELKGVRGRLARADLAMARLRAELARARPAPGAPSGAAPVVVPEAPAPPPSVTLDGVFLDGRLRDRTLVVGTTTGEVIELLLAPELEVSGAVRDASGLLSLPLGTPVHITYQVREGRRVAVRVEARQAPAAPATASAPQEGGVGAAPRGVVSGAAALRAALAAFGFSHNLVDRVDEVILSRPLGPDLSPAPGQPTARARSVGDPMWEVGVGPAPGLTGATTTGTTPAR